LEKHQLIPRFAPSSLRLFYPLELIHIDRLLGFVPSRMGPPLYSHMLLLKATSSFIINELGYNP
jgi:hypothetical protein